MFRFAQGSAKSGRLGMRDAETPRHLFVEKSLARTIGLHPFSINDKLRDRPLAGLLKDFIGGAGRGLDINFAVGNFVLVEETLGLAAIRTVKG